MRPKPSQIGLTLLALCALAPGTLAQTPPPQPAPAPPTSGPPPAAALAATPEVLAPGELIAALRQELQVLEQEIESLRARIDPEATADDPASSRLAELERRLGEVEAELQRLRREAAIQTPPTSTGPAGPADPAGLGTFNLAGDTGQVSSGTAFNPSISVIPDGVYSNDDRDGGGGEIASRADGFHTHGGGEGHSHGGGVEPGFSLREAELSFSGAVDPYFDVWAIFAVAGGEFEVEETYVLTRRFIPGFQLKFGKFYSSIGYVNRQHPHQWDFVDQALPYDALLGGALNETGVQLTWLPNLPFYTQLGVEALQGENEGMASQIGESDATPWFSSKAGPRLVTAFLKVSPDVGYSDTLQVGVSYVYASQHQELHDENEDGIVDEAFQGHARLVGLDAVWKHDSPRPYGKGDLTVQAEYLYRVKDLDLVAEAGEPALAASVKFKQDGLYAQAVYGIFARWTAGVRFDVIGLTNAIEGGGESASFETSRRYTADLTFNPTEFSRLRAQVAHGEFHVGGVKETYNQLDVQFQMSLGAHGAHRF